MKTERNTEHVQVVVIGGGQGGLSVGYCLQRAGLSFVILDANARVGDSWRRRWDSLRLFTPARFDGLIGMPFPAPSSSFPTKDDMANYLEAYVERFALPVRTGVAWRSSFTRRLSLHRVCGRSAVHRGSRRRRDGHISGSAASAVGGSTRPEHGSNCARTTIGTRVN